MVMGQLVSLLMNTCIFVFYHDDAVSVFLLPLYFLRIQLHRGIVRYPARSDLHTILQRFRLPGQTHPISPDIHRSSKHHPTGHGLTMWWPFLNKETSSQERDSLFWHKISFVSHDGLPLKVWQEQMCSIQSCFISFYEIRLYSARIFLYSSPLLHTMVIAMSECFICQ